MVENYTDANDALDGDKWKRFAFSHVDRNPNLLAIYQFDQEVAAVGLAADAAFELLDRVGAEIGIGIGIAMRFRFRFRIEFRLGFSTLVSIGWLQIRLQSNGARNRRLQVSGACLASGVNVCCQLLAALIG